MPVADWNERSRISFQAIAPRTSGITKLTRIRNQPIASALNGVTTGTLEGLICVCGAGVATVAVAVAAGVVVGVLTAFVVVGPAVTAKGPKDVVGFGSKDGTFTLFDAATGALQWQDKLALGGNLGGFFNSAFDWSAAEAGESGRFDIQSTALHDIGPLSGLGHSALGETELREGGGRRVLAADAVMFPIAYGAGTIAGRTLRADDIAGISDIYPGSGFRTEFGSISGKITKNGSPLFGAHVVAFDPRDGTLVATFSLGSQGDFSIAGLSPGPHILRVEPIDDADLDSFFSAARNVDINFRVTYADRIVTVPKGGDSGSISVQVAPK